MFSKKLVGRLAVFTLSAMAISTISMAADLEIKQEDYVYQMPLTQNVYTETFVITTTPSSQKFLQRPFKITALFQLNSGTLLPPEKNLLLSNLRKNQVSKTTPLTVTGYTCQRGTDQLNQALSLQRAKAVASFLKSSGYSVVAVEGKGALKSSNSEELFKNRRVEITALKP